ncbi:MAG TPA: DEAD/DEAH box helicase family protein [Beijerinckiaceae bacterium]
MVKREVTARPVEIVAGAARRGRLGRIDFVLRVRVNPSTAPVALALIEAKAENLPPNHGLEQAKAYARGKLHNVPFVFSSNGHQFVCFDRRDSTTSPPRPMSEFPTVDELRARYEQRQGFSLTDDRARPLLTPYPGGEADRRYYQDAAIRAVLEKIARGEKKALLVLATGTGKTFIAVNLLRRIADAGQLRRALFVCDRDELRKQALAAFANRFGADAAEVYRREDGSNNAKNARVHIATFQTLGVASEGDDASFLLDHYPPDSFSHIIIDECHRSAWGKWFQVLERNPGAVQIGLTATPRELEIPEDSEEAKNDARIRAHNFRYFGEPVYEYDVAQGIEDGYLAACEIVKRDVFLEGKPAPEAQTGLDREDLSTKVIKDSITGRFAGFEETEAHYDAGVFESRLELPDRVRQMCADLFDHLLATGGPEQKTIIFCQRDSHADWVAVEMNNLYARWAAANSQRAADPYAFKCTASVGGAGVVPDFKGAERSHFIATTVDLLTTGVDVPPLRNVVFFRYMKSPIAFYQMVGRGTRIHEPSGKLMFRVYDYTDATRLFGERFLSDVPRVSEPTPPPPAKPDQDEPEDTGGPKVRTFVVEGVTVRIEDGGRFILMKRDGRDMRVPIQEYRAQLVERLVKEAPDLSAFRNVWIEPQHRRELIDSLVVAGYAPRVLQAVLEMEDYDSFDVLGEAAYGLSPRTRAGRVDQFRSRHKMWLESMPGPGRAVMLALAQQFARGGTEELESPSVLRVPAVARAGGLSALRALGQPQEVLKTTRERLFEP